MVASSCKQPYCSWIQTTFGTICDFNSQSWRSIYSILKWKPRAEGGSQIRQCNSTCVIHVWISPYQHAMRFLMCTIFCRLDLMFQRCWWPNTSIQRWTMAKVLSNQTKDRQELVNLMHIFCLSHFVSQVITKIIMVTWELNTKIVYCHKAKLLELTLLVKCLFIFVSMTV